MANGRKIKGTVERRAGWTTLDGHYPSDYNKQPSTFGYMKDIGDWSLGKVMKFREISC